MENNGWLIVIAILAFVILVNISFVFSFIRRMKSKQKGIFHEPIVDLLNPWKKEDEALEELHQRVEDLKGRDGGTH